MNYQNSDLHIRKRTYQEYCITQPNIFIGTYYILQIISGYVEYFNIDTNEITRYISEDTCVIDSHSRFALKIKKGTILIEISLSGYCKEISITVLNKKYSEWVSQSIQPYRKDYFHDPSAPLANSIRPAASAVIVNDKNQILLLHRRDNNKWAIPGGTLEYNESIEQCLIREIKEETNLDIEIIKVFKIYSDPEAIIAYLDGEIRREFNVVYLAKVLSNEVIIDEESSQFSWIDIEQVHLMPLSLSQKRRILDIQKLLIED